MSVFILRMNNWVALTHVPLIMCVFFGLEIKSGSWNENKDVDFTQNELL